MSQPTISAQSTISTQPTKIIIDEKPKQKTARIGCGIMLLGHDD